MEIFLEVFSSVSSNGVCDAPIETLIFTYMYKYLRQPPLLFTLVQSTELNGRASFKIKLPRLLFDFFNEYDVEPPGNLCKLPMIMEEGSVLHISGLCSVLRQMILLLEDESPLLGYKQGCLNACTESSVWTKFCEVDLIKTIDKLFTTVEWPEENLPLPKDLARFERHMARPVKTHNIQKEKQELAKREGNYRKGRSRDSEGRVEVLKDLEHTYAEGLRMTLADLVIFPCVHLMFRLFSADQMKLYVPKTHKWYENMMKDTNVMEGIEFIASCEELPYGLTYVLPYVPDESLYRCERKKPRRSCFSSQFVMENCFEILINIEEQVKISEKVFGHEVTFDWTNVPFEIQLVGRDFPKARLERKAQQLENMIKAVLKLAKPGNRIVDFCAGSGYLGLILAHCLPSCTIILVENKEESLRRAVERASTCKLTNVTFCQGNVDYFIGEFQIGVALHACGIATDLVIEKCLYRKASFICCPCCYGFLEKNHMVKYPRSAAVRELGLPLSDYFTLAHAADEAADEEENVIDHGKRCMNIIDGDRYLSAKEYNYEVYLSSLEPHNCTPKNNLLVGIPKENSIVKFQS